MTVHQLTLAAVFALASQSLPVAARPASADQRQPAAQIIPPGFKLTLDQAFGPAVAFEATKPNDACPAPHQDPMILASGGWTPNPAAAMVVAMMADAPEEPETTAGVTRDEPLGKERYKGGVLTWRKTTTPWVGSGDGPDLVTVSGVWAGSGHGMMLGAGVHRFCGSKDAARGWIGHMIDALANGKRD